MVNPITDRLERYLDLLASRQKLVASNMANVDTPGYQTQDIDFRREWESVINGKPETVPVSGLPVKNDGNNVSLDREARLLAENALRFNLVSGLMRAELRALRSAIQEGRSA